MVRRAATVVEPVREPTITTAIRDAGMEGNVITGMNTVYGIIKTFALPREASAKTRKRRTAHPHPAMMRRDQKEMAGGMIQHGIEMLNGNRGTSFGTSDADACKFA